MDKNINKILRIFIKQEPVKLKNIRHNIFYLHLVYVHFFRNECTDVCKQRQRNIENDIKQLKRDLMLREEQYRQLEYENQVIRSFCFNLCILICYLRVVLYTVYLCFEFLQIRFQMISSSNCIKKMHVIELIQFLSVILHIMHIGKLLDLMHSVEF